MFIAAWHLSFRADLNNFGFNYLTAIVIIIYKNKIPIILETPIDNVRDDFENIRKVKKLA